MDASAIVAAAVVLLAANGFFVAGEFALVKTAELPPKKLGMEANKAARLAALIRTRLEDYLSTCRLVITITSLGLGWTGALLVEAILEPWFRSLGVPDAVLTPGVFSICFVVFCALHAAIGQRVPMLIAIRHPETVASYAAFPLHVAHLALRLPNKLLEAASDGALGFLRVEKPGAERSESAERSIAPARATGKHAEATRDGMEVQRARIAQDQRPVSRVMTPRRQVHALDLGADSEENLFIMCETDHTRFPVVDGADNGKIVGVLKAHDVFNHVVDGVRLDWEDSPWKNLRRFCCDPLVIAETQRISEVFELLLTEPLGIALVVDDEGAMSGLVTLEDLLGEREGGSGPASRPSAQTSEQGRDRGRNGGGTRRPPDVGTPTD